jgi:hypothetical protein
MAKLRNLYDMDSFAALQHCGGSRGFTDTAGGVILARNLTAIDPIILEVKYPELAFVNAGIDFSNTGGYAKQITTLRTAEHGNFAVSGDSADNKGKISLSMEDSYIPVIAKEAHSIWSDDEIKTAELQGINIVAQYINAHRKIYLQEIDDAGFIGIIGNSNNIKYRGLLNTTLFNSDTAANTINNMTFQQAYDEISGLIQAQWSAVNNIPQYMADRVVMPTRVMNAIQSKIELVNGQYINVLEALRKNYPQVKFLSTHKAENVAPFNTSVTVAFSTSPEAMKMRVPVPLSIGQIVRQSSFHFRIDSKYRVAGLDILESASGMILKGL